MARSLQGERATAGLDVTKPAAPGQAASTRSVCARRACLGRAYCGQESSKTLVLANDQRRITVQVFWEGARVQTEYHDPAPRGTSAKLSHGLAHVQIRHLRVQQHDIWAKCLRAVNRIGRMIRFGQHAQVRLEQQTSDKRPPDEQRIFEQHESDHLKTFLIASVRTKSGKGPNSAWSFCNRRPHRPQLVMIRMQPPDRSTGARTTMRRHRPGRLCPELVNGQQADPPGVQGCLSAALQPELA